MVITCEPGIYFINSKLKELKENSKLKNYLNFVKIEEY